MRVTSLALVATSLTAATPGHAALDPWLGADKFTHFGVTTSLAVAGYAAGVDACPIRPADARACAIAFSVVISLGAGVAKEVLDYSGLWGMASWRDLTWDVLGSVTGLLAALGIDLMSRPAVHPSVAVTPTRASVSLSVAF